MRDSARLLSLAMLGCWLGGCVPPEPPPLPTPPDPTIALANDLAGRYLFWAGSKTLSLSPQASWCYLDIEAAFSRQPGALRVTPWRQEDEEEWACAQTKVTRSGTFELILTRTYLLPSARRSEDDLWDPDQEEDSEEVHETWTLSLRRAVDRRLEESEEEEGYDTEPDYDAESRPSTDEEVFSGRREWEAEPSVRLVGRGWIEVRTAEGKVLQRRRSRFSGVLAEEVSAEDVFARFAADPPEPKVPEVEFLGTNIEGE